MACQRTVFIVNIEDASDSQGLFVEMYGPLMEQLQKTPSLTVSIIDSTNTFESKCIGCNPKETVLLFSNEIISEKRNLQEIVKKFVNDGGLAIFGCLFPSFTKPPLMNAMFENLGMPWKSADYNRTTFGVTQIGQTLLTNIDAQFSVKALQLADVALQHKLYTPVENATTKSMVFAPKPANAALAMSAFGKIGKGAIAYVGDVNAEKEANRLTVALCLAKW